MTRYVALLRGINLGRRMRMDMRALRDLLTGIGLQDVATHLQSGNVLFTSDAPEPELATELERAIDATFGLRVPCLLRTGAQLRAVAEANPLAEAAGGELSRLHVVFLSAAPEPAALSGVDPARYHPEQFRPGHREIYLWVPPPLAATRLGNAFWERKLGLTATTRNWNTTRRLAELASR